MSTPQCDELMVRYLEGVATPAEVAELESALSAEEALRREFVRLAHLQALFADLPLATAQGGGPWPRGRRWAAAASIAALLAIALLWQLRPAAAGGPLLSALSGAVRIQRGGGEVAAVRGMRLRAGDRLMPGAAAECIVAWADGSTVLAAEGSALVLGGPAAVPLTLEHGMLYAAVVHDPARGFAIATPDAMARDIGTAFAVQADGTGTLVRVDHGLVALSNRLGMVEIAAGASARARSGQPPQLVPAANASAPPTTPPPPTSAPPAPENPGELTVSGTVTAVDGARRSFSLRDDRTGAASDYRPYYAGGHTDAVQAQIATLKVGDALTVTYLDKEGRRAVRIRHDPPTTGK